MPHVHHRAAGLIAAAVGACLLLGVGGTARGTFAQWHTVSTAPGGTIDSGGLAVGIVPLQDGIGGVPLMPGTTLESRFEVHARLVGDNLDAGLAIRVPDWEEQAGADLRDALDVTVTIDGHAVSGDLLDPTGPVLYLVQDAGAPIGDGEVPVVEMSSETLTMTLVLRVSMSAGADDRHEGEVLPSAELFALLDQVRPGTPTSTPALWATSGRTTVPPLVLGPTEVPDKPVVEPESRDADAGPSAPAPTDIPSGDATSDLREPVEPVEPAGPHAPAAPTVGTDAEHPPFDAESPAARETRTP